MTDKNWFIFKGDHHLGPFTFNEILNKVKLAELNNEELLWREGDPDWKSVHNQEDIVTALKKEKEGLLEERNKLEQRARASQQREFAAKAIKEREAQKLADSEKMRKAAAEKQIERQKVLDQEIARNKARALKAEREIEEKQRQKEMILKRQAEEAARVAEVEPGPPPLPPIPIVPDIPEQAESIEPKRRIEEERIEEERIEEEVGEEISEEEASEEEVFEDEVFEAEYFDEDEQILRGRSFYSAIGLAVFVGLVFLFSYGFLFETERSLAGLSKRDKESLRNISDQKFSGVALHKLRPTADLNSLWLASNFPSEAAVYLRMESMKGRLLSDGKVVIQASSKFVGHAALFKELEVIEGDGLVPGEYLYEIKGFQTGLMKNLRKGLGDLSLFKELKAFRPERSEFNFKGTILVSASSVKKFDSILQKKKENIEKKILRPLKDRRQRLKTFLNLLDQVELIYNNILGRITKGKSMYLFEKRYNKEVGPYLRDLIIDTNKVHVSLLNLDPKESKAYEDIMNFGKDVGHISSEMVTKTRKVRRLGRAKTEVMKERFRLMVDELRQKGKSQLRQMNGTINKFEGN